MDFVLVLITLVIGTALVAEFFIIPPLRASLARRGVKGDVLRSGEKCAWHVISVYLPQLVEACFIQYVFTQCKISLDLADIF